MLPDEHRRLVVALAVIGILVRAYFVVPILAGESLFVGGDDRTRYHAIARNVVSGNGYSKAAGEPFLPDELDQPAYPLFVAAIYSVAGENQRAVVLVQLGIEVAILVLMLLLARELGLSPGARTALLAAGCLNPILAIFATMLLTEVLATLAITLACWLVVRAVIARCALAWFWAGAACGGALLVRADLVIAVALMLLAGILLVATRESLARAGLLVGTALFAGAAVMAPWMARNVVAFGELRPLGGVAEQTRMGYVQWLDTWLDRPSDVARYWWLHPKRRPFPHERLTASERELAEAAYAADRDDDAFRALARERIRARPLSALVAVPVRRLMATWLGLPNHTFRSFSGAGLLYLRLVWWAITLSAAVGLVAMAVQRLRLGLVLVGLLLGRIAIPLVSALGAEPRYLLEALPICLLLAGVAFDLMAKRGPALLGGSAEQ